MLSVAKASSHHHRDWEKHSREKLQTLSPEFRHRVEHVLALLRAQGWEPIVFHGRRTQEQQAILIKKGYGGKLSWHVADTHYLAHKNGRYCMYTGEAADIVDKRYLWQGPAKNLDYKFWTDLGKFAKQCGLEWG